MPYINTIDINGEIYNVGNLTDGTHVVNLPTLTQSGTFLLQEDVVNNLTSTNDKAPLSASQGRVLDGKISALKTSASQDDASTLSSAKTYANEKANEALTSANKHTDSSCETINNTVSALSTTVDNNKSATDTAIANLQKTVQDNKSSADTGASEVKTYADDTFIAKSKIADNLTTNSSEQVLSAKQGKALEDKKFDKAGGTITGPVTLNGNLAMGANNIISITQTPVADNNVVNKKYVDDTVASYEIGDASVTTAKVADSAITKVKLAAETLSYIDDLMTTNAYNQWQYMKMRNGVAIAWATYSVEIPSGQESISGNANYPSGLFVSRPVCTISVSSNSTFVSYKSVNTGNEIKPSSITISKEADAASEDVAVEVSIDYFAIGKWK